MAVTVRVSYSTSPFVQMTVGPEILHLQHIGVFTGLSVRAWGACSLVCTYPQPEQMPTMLLQHAL